MSRACGAPGGDETCMHSNRETFLLGCERPAHPQHWMLSHPRLK